MATTKPVRRHLAKLPTPDETLKEAWNTVCAMEYGLTSAKNFARGLAFLAESMDECHASVVQEIAWALKEHVERVEEYRGRLFRHLHPSRAEFERTGWPD